jgi:Bacterial PH domain
VLSPSFADNADRVFGAPFCWRVGAHRGQSVRVVARSREVWRCGPFMRFGGGVLVAVAVGGTLLMSVVIVGMLSREQWSQAGWAVATTAIVAGPVGLFGWRCCLHPVVTVAENELRVRNPTSTMRLRWSEIESASATYSGVAIRTRSGEVVRAWAVQKSNLATWIGRTTTRADRLADMINRRAGAFVLEA